MAEGKEKKTTHQNHKRPSASFLLTLCPERLFGGSPYSLLPTLAARLGRSATPQRRPSGGVPQAAAPSPRPASPRRGRPPPSPPMRAGAVTAPRHGAAAKMAKVSEMYDVTWEGTAADREPGAGGSGGRGGSGSGPCGRRRISAARGGPAWSTAAPGGEPRGAGVSPRDVLAPVAGDARGGRGSPLCLKDPPLPWGQRCCSPLVLL